MQVVARAGASFLDDGGAGPGPEHDVGVVGGDEGVQGARLVRRNQQQGMAGREGREIGDEGVQVVGRRQDREPAPDAQAGGDLVDAFGQFPVAQRPVLGEDGGPLPVTGEAGREGRPGQVWVRGHGATLEEMFSEQQSCLISPTWVITRRERPSEAAAER